VSNLFLDTVSECFDDVAASVRASRAGHLASDRAPTWAGWAAVERIARDHALDDLNLVKPGIGEATRVLLRRVPWQILINPEHEDELAHVRLLAEEREVPLVPYPGLPYSCVGLIKPIGR
jgi:hypothetical protein